MDDSKAKHICNRFAELKTERGELETIWQEIRELVRPGTSDFNRKTSQGKTRTECIYDSTAPEALEELASGLHSYLTNPADRWFGLEVQDMREINDDPESLLWLEQVADAIYAEFSNEQTGFNTALHEAYMDIGAFGTCVVNQEWDRNELHLTFRTHPLASAYVAESHSGRVDTVYRMLPMTRRQMEQEFGEEALPRQIKSNQDETKKYEVIHAVYPRSDRNPYKLDAKNMKYASCWVSKEFGHTLRESGYKSLPYHVPRWNKLAEDVYGRGPAVTCLPDIRMLNRMEYTVIRAAQKAVDPPLVVPNDGFVLPLRTAPGSVNFKEPGADPVEVLEHKGRFDVALERCDQKRESIRKCFFSDVMRLEMKKERQTAFEIHERIEQQLRNLAPMLGRLSNELLGPTLERSYELLHEANRFPEAPPALQRKQLKLVYISTAARAQRAIKASSAGRWVQEMLPVAQVDPSVFEPVNWEAYARETALQRGVTRTIFFTPEEMAQKRAERQQQQQIAAAAEIAKPASEAVKNIATANSLGGI